MPRRSGYHAGKGGRAARAVPHLLPMEVRAVRDVQPPIAVRAVADLPTASLPGIGFPRGSVPQWQRREAGAHRTSRSAAEHCSRCVEHGRRRAARSRPGFFRTADQLPRGPLVSSRPSRQPAAPVTMCVVARAPWYTLSAQAPHVACCMQHVARRVLHVARRVLHVARRVLHVARRVLHVACSTSRVACCTSRVACSMLHVACCMLHVACCMLHVARRGLHVARHGLHAACSTSRVACCSLRVACCPSRVACCMECGAQVAVASCTV
jgi:hypothetical protein